MFAKAEAILLSVPKPRCRKVNECAERKSHLRGGVNRTMNRKTCRVDKMCGF